MSWTVRIAAVASLSIALGCAQQLGDIDRTQPNRILKADLSGIWYMLETVTELPPTSWASFTGETSKLERIVWRVEEDYLFAYRAYPLLPGSDDVTRQTDYADPGYQEAPVAAYPILSHFDIIRSYNSSTGEQQNVIVENTSDLPWYEREYIRVDWSQNAITNLDLLSEWFATPVEASYTVDAERREDRSIYFEREGDELVYFDIPQRLLVEPDWYGCIISMPWYGWSTEDCTAAELEVTVSFARTEGVSDYEPYRYDDQNMTRFGYFRSERYIYDNRRGPLESTRQEMINRFNIWEAAYQRDGAGDYRRDADGQRIPIPMEERETRTIPYYLSPSFPTEDPLMEAAAQATMSEWNDIARESVAQIRGEDIGRVGDIFITCHTPVTADDPDACGGAGFVARAGDLRYSVLHWVEMEQIEGLLGYGPPASDPVTGETISGRAYVYGSGINRYANYGVDVVRFMNGDIDGSELMNAEHVRESVLERARGNDGVDRTAPELSEVPLGHRSRRARERLTARDQRREHLRPFDRSAVFARMEQAREAGLSGARSNEEYQRVLAARLGTPLAEVTADQQDRHDPTRWLSPTHFSQFQRGRRNAMSRGVDYAEMIDPNVLGIARHYEGETDYDLIFREIRAEVFRATALHEVGHTVGLRHNFQGSYDSLNYFDRYWELRSENLTTPTNRRQLYRLNEITENQINGRMREYQYSSIMDYGLTFHSDLKGLGRYDRAAFVFGYTAGTSEGPGLTNGFVEVFAKRLDELGELGAILSEEDETGHPYEDLIVPNVPYLERWHYTTVMNAFPNQEDATDREWMRLDSYLAEREAGADNRPVRVPYLFCSDEWVEALLSCQVFDSGADPLEMTQTIVDHYRAYYYFDNFKRDRLGWDAWNAFIGAYYYVFLPLSNYYQNWYLAPWGWDDIFDDYYWFAVNAGVNLIGEAIATPPYGTFCTGPNGQLVHLFNEPGGDPQQAGDYYLAVYCDTDEPFYQVEQGEGRRRFSAYDQEAGYNFADLTLEAGHYWTTLAAFWALIDPEAFVLGSDGDAGVFSISYYDFFDEEVHNLTNAVVNEDYSAYSPRLVGTEGDSSLVFQPLSTVWDPQRQNYVDPLSGRPFNPDAGPVVETDATFSLFDDMMYYGMLYTTFSYNTRFNDQINVFRVGTDETITPGEGFEVVSFTDPISGHSYGAVAEICPAGLGGGPVGLCESCDSHTDCAGYTGELGATWCQYLESEDDEVWYCLVDCTDTDEFCPDGTSCDEVGNCVPNGLSCDGLGGACGVDNPLGSCDEGTCIRGSCIADVSPRCRYGYTENTGGAQLVARGAELAQRYNETLEAYWQDNGRNEARELQLYREFSRAQFEMTNHIDKLNTIRAVFSIFGMVY
jgi:hypothetical protein